MPNGRAFDDALALLPRLTGLGVGIHLSLVGERSVAPPSSLGRLVDADGMLPPAYLAFTRALMQRRFGVEEVRTELTAQIRRALDAGVTPTHLDSHQHLHLLPGLLPMVIELAREYHIPVIRAPYEVGGFMVGNPVRAAQVGVLCWLSRRGRAAIRRAGIRQTDHFWGLRDTGALTEPALARLLARLRRA